MSLENCRELIGRHCRVRDRSRGVSGCLYHASRYELLRHQGTRQSAASANKRRINMEPTLTQNCATLLRATQSFKRSCGAFQEVSRCGPHAEAECSAAADLWRLIHRTATSSGQRVLSRFIDIMDSLTFVSSQRQESDSVAERRWENEGGNPGQLQQLPCEMTAGILTERKSLARGDSAPTVEAAIPVDNPVSKNN